MSKKPRTLRVIGHNQCRWVIGDDKGIDTLFCAEQTNKGSSYCNKHHHVVYGKVKAYSEKEIDYLLWLWERHSPSFIIPTDGDDEMREDTNRVVSFYRGLSDHHDD